VLKKHQGAESEHQSTRSGIQGQEIVGDEQPIFADQLIVKPDLTAAVIRPLDADEVPMDG